MLQPRCWHSVSWPGQSVGFVQPVQLPALSQVKVVPHDVPKAAGAWLATPASQRSLVHGLLSSGMSVSSFSSARLPWPSHTIFLQSPAFCCATAVPAAVNTGAQRPFVQARWAHSFSLPGQSERSVHGIIGWPPSPPAPLALLESAAGSGEAAVGLDVVLVDAEELGAPEGRDVRAREGAEDCKAEAHHHTPFTFTATPEGPISTS
ncbi:MAG: hypothetical protein QM820_22755 [Minicystis sp.]